MNSIYLNRVQAVGEQLLGQMLVLEDILEELGEIDRIIQEMSFTVEASLLIRKSRAELDKEIYMIHITYTKKITVLREFVLYVVLFGAF